MTQFFFRLFPQNSDFNLKVLYFFPPTQAMKTKKEKYSLSTNPKQYVAVTGEKKAQSPLSGSADMQYFTVTFFMIRAASNPQSSRCFPLKRR